MARQERFSALPLDGRTQQLPERSNFSVNANSNFIGDDSMLTDAYSTMDRNPSFDYESNVLIKEAKLVSINRSPNLNLIRKSPGQEEIEFLQRSTCDSSPRELNDGEELPRVKRDRESSLSDSSPETVLSSYFSDTEDTDTPTSPVFNIQNEMICPHPTLRQIRTGVLAQEDSCRTMESKPRYRKLTLSLPPQKRSETISVASQRGLESLGQSKEGQGAGLGSGLEDSDIESINDAEKMIKSYFADTNLMSQDLSSNQNSPIQHPEYIPQSRKGSDGEILLNLSTGRRRSSYSKGKRIPPLLYNEKTDSSSENLCDPNRTPTNEFIPSFDANHLLVSKSCSTSSNHSRKTIVTTSNRLRDGSTSEESHKSTSVDKRTSSQNNQIDVRQTLPLKLHRQSSFALAPSIPQKSSKRPQVLQKSASHSNLSMNLNHLNDFEQFQVPHLPLHGDLMKRNKKKEVSLNANKSHTLRVSRSETTLDESYKAIENLVKETREMKRLATPIQSNERPSLILSRIGYNPNELFTKDQRFDAKLAERWLSSMQLNPSAFQHEAVSDDELGFSTNVTPIPPRSARLIRSMAAFKSFSKRFTGRKSQMFDFAQKMQFNEMSSNQETMAFSGLDYMMKLHLKDVNAAKILSQMAKKDRFGRDQIDRKSFVHDSSSDALDTNNLRSQAVSPFQQIYANAQSIKKPSGSSEDVINKKRSYL